eukprot:s1185_g5.t1
MTSDPEKCIGIAKRVLRHLKNTLDHGLVMKPFQNTAAKAVIQVFCDASFAPTGDYSHHRLALMWEGVPLCWHSSRETLAALNAAEAEVYAAAAGLPLALNMRDTPTSMDVPCDVEMLVDSQAALRVASPGEPGVSSS